MREILERGRGGEKREGRGEGEEMEKREKKEDSSKEHANAYHTIRIAQSIGIRWLKALSFQYLYDHHFFKPPFLFFLLPFFFIVFLSFLFYFFGSFFGSQNGCFVYNKKKNRNYK